jgi:hypothetical protein
MFAFCSLLLSCGTNSSNSGIDIDSTSSVSLSVEEKKPEPLKGMTEEEKLSNEKAFAAMKPTKLVKAGTLQLKFSSVSINKQWTFDNYGDQWFYRDAERGDKFIIVKVSISSDEKDPSLLPISLYKFQYGHLKLLTTLDYKFVRWDDYGSYLGNYSDYKNDFAHTKIIPFTCAETINEEELKSSSIYVVVNTDHCFTRNVERFDNPPVTYSSSGCNVPETLSASDIGKENFIIKAYLKR